jgi:cell division protease FtsH
VEKDAFGQGSAKAVPETDLRELARSLSGLFGQVRRLASQQSDNRLADYLGGHLGVDPRGLPVLSHELPSYQLVDLQVALEAWATAAPDRALDVVGVSGDQRRFHPLSELLTESEIFGVGVGPVEYADLADSPDSTRSCVKFGMFLMRAGERRAGALVRGADPHGPIQNAMLEIVAVDREWGRNLLGELRELAVSHSVLRGQVLALGVGEGNAYGALRFLHRPALTRDELVLPDATLQQIERHVVGIATHEARLRAAGQHTKRGVLLYGPPGTGKTHTIRYLLSSLPAQTAFILSGQALQLIGQACGLARLLQPSIVILEDIDLIAADRSFGPMGSNPLLFEVLNQIDGLGDDVNVTFLLTTNRVDILERALAERPGRVDAAVEIVPPDDGGRARLFRLYGAGVGLDELTDEDMADAITATAGRTATYLREVVRRAALSVAEREADGPLRVDAATLAIAAGELLDDRAALTRALLGGAEEPDAEPPLVSPGGLAYASGPKGRMMQWGGAGPHFGASGSVAPFGGQDK